MVLPDWPKFKVICLYTILATIAFAGVYGWCNLQASVNPVRYSMFTQWELGIPLVPWMIYPYVSLNVLFVLAAFVLKDISSVKGFCISMIVSVFIAGFIFYFFPGQLGFVRESVPGYESMYDFMFSIDHPHNLFPSLHVTYSSLAVFAMIEQTSNKAFHVFMWIWLATVAASVVLVHQHHFFDIATGFILALAMYKYVYAKIHNTKSA